MFVKGKKTFYLLRCEKFLHHLNYGIADKSREIYFQFRTVIDIMMIYIYPLI